MLDHLVLDRARRIAPFDDVSDHDADRALAVLAAVRDRRLAPAAVPQHADRGDADARWRLLGLGDAGDDAHCLGRVSATQ